MSSASGYRPEYNRLFVDPAALAPAPNPVAPLSPARAPLPVEVAPVVPPQPATRLTGAVALTAEGAADGSRWQQLRANPEVREGTKALARTLGNAGISLADFVPGIGDAVSWGADATKLFKKTDFLTPDVKRRWAWISELLEFIPFMPTHAIEGTMQLRHDWRRMRTGLRAASTILRGQQPAAPAQVPVRRAA